MATVTTLGKKAAAAALVALTLGAGMVATTNKAEARGGRKGALIAAGVLGALAVGVMAANSAHAAPSFYGETGYDDYEPAPVYYQRPRPVYDEPYHDRQRGDDGYPHRRPYPDRRHYPGYSETSMGYHGPVCKIRKQQVWDGYGWRIQRVQVCR